MSTVFDVIVVGAGPAGSCAAIAARLAGASVLLLDKSAPGRDKVCGDAIGFETLDVLARLGVPDVIHPAERVNRYRLVWPGVVEVSGAPPRPGFVIPRKSFDRRLYNRAIEAGASFHQGTVSNVTQGGNVALADGTQFYARTVIGADGANSATRRFAGIPPVSESHRAVAIRGYLPRPDGFDDLVIAWDPDRVGNGRAYAWAFPTADGRVNVGYGDLITHPRGGRRGMTERLRAVLGDAGVSLPLDGVKLVGANLPLNSTPAAYGRGRILLTGDAANLINAISGEGIHHACLSGMTAGFAATSDTPLASYRDEMNRRLRHHHTTMRWLSRVTTSYSVRTALAASASDPALFESLTTMALGSGSFTPIMAGRITRGWARMKLNRKRVSACGNYCG